MIFEPASSCMTSPEVTIGLMPSSMQVPLHINAHVSMIGSYLAFKLDFKTAISKAARDTSVTIGAAQKHKQQDRIRKCFGGGDVCCRTISSMQTSPKLLACSHLLEAMITLAQKNGSWEELDLIP